MILPIESDTLGAAGDWQWGRGTGGRMNIHREVTAHRPQKRFAVGYRLAVVAR